MTRARGRDVLALVLAVLVAAGCRGGEDAGRPVRFIDQLSAPQRVFGTAIDGVSMPTLPPIRAEFRFPITTVPRHPVLSFAVGVAPEPTPVAVRFEVLLQPAAGAAVELFRAEHATPGWRETRIDLAGRELDGATIIFRRSTPGGAPDQTPRGWWGNPMLMSAEPAPRTAAVLVSLDTLRADFVGAYGRASARTPGLDRLAREGTLFETAYSPSNWTVPSHASLLYGLHLPENNARPGIGAADEAQPLAELLRRAGYLTAGFTGGGFLDWQFDFQRGFDVYFAFQQPSPHGAECRPERFDGKAVFEHAVDWLRANAGQPFFLFVHTYDIHDRCPFEDPKARVLMGWPPLSPERQRELLAYYDSLVAETDTLMVKLLAALDELGRRDSTLVVVTADHGEAFEEHGQRGHGCDRKPYEEVTRVPLIVRAPGRVPAGVRVPEPVSLIDVAPTMLSLLGVEVPTWMAGQGLPGLGGTRRDPEPPVFVQCDDVLAVRRGSDKLIASRAGRYPDELYDLAADPREQRPLADRPEIAAALRADAERFWRTAAAKPTPLDPKQMEDALKERLRALGYLE